MRRKRDERAVSFQHRSIRFSPLPMGDQEFETQRGFLHKDPNNGSQDIFSLSLPCFMLYTFSLFSAFPSTFLSWKEKELGYLMKLEIWILEVQNACRRQTNQSCSNFFLSVFWPLLAGWWNMLLCMLLKCKDSLTDSQMLFKVNKCQCSARRASYIEINKLIILRYYVMLL